MTDLPPGHEQPSFGRVPPPGAVAPRRRMGGPLFWVLGLSAAFFVLFLVVSGAFFLKGGSHSGGKKTSASIFGGGAVGVIELSGVIMDSKKILGKLEDFEDDDRVKAVVLRLN